MKLLLFSSFREVKNLERFSLVVQSITRLALVKFKQLPDFLLQEQLQEQQLSQQQLAEPRPPDPRPDIWNLEDVEKLVSYLSRYVCVLVGTRYNFDLTFSIASSNNRYRTSMLQYLPK